MYLGVFGHGPPEQGTATNNVLEGVVGDSPSTLVVGGGRPLRLVSTLLTLSWTSQDCGIQLEKPMH